jgi:2-polyprenyl-6-methoxyphenol hydroxylase-like FAD-dependent oxidoreductase
MVKHDYDLIVAGGGLAGSALATAMSRHGARVLVIEREEAFKDRVRGEGVSPWGVAEARALGIYETLRDGCGYEIRWWDMHAGPAVFRRDLIETTPQRAPLMNFSHPEMQELLLRTAAASGAEVRRGANVTAVMPGEIPRVKVEQDGNAQELSARLVVGADGRGSRVRSWAGFAVEQDAPRLFIGGVLFEGASAPTDAATLIQGFGRLAIFYPQRNGRMRAYAVYHRELCSTRLQGPADVPRFIEASALAGTPPGWLDGARAVGPLATFEGADTWAPHPYRDGVVLIGDAAAATDPSFGQGLSLTLRDVRTLRDALVGDEDWAAAAHAYAEAHDRYYGTLHTLVDWYTRLFMEVGPAADARRGKALPLLMQDPTRMPDVLISGPNQPLGEEDRIRFIGE